VERETKIGLFSVGLSKKTQWVSARLSYPGSKHPIVILSSPL